MNTLHLFTSFDAVRSTTPVTRKESVGTISICDSVVYTAMVVNVCIYRLCIYFLYLLVYPIDGRSDGSRVDGCGVDAVRSPK